MLDETLLVRAKLRHNIQRLIDAAESHCSSLNRSDVIENLEAHRLQIAIDLMRDFFRINSNRCNKG